MHARRRKDLLNDTVEARMTLCLVLGSDSGGQTTNQYSTAGSSGSWYNRTPEARQVVGNGKSGNYYCNTPSSESSVPIAHNYYWSTITVVQISAFI